MRNKLQSDIDRIHDYKLLLRITLTISLGAFYNGYTLTYFNAIQYSQIVTIYHLQNFPQAITQGFLTGIGAFAAAIGSIVSYFLLCNFSKLKCLKVLSALGAFVGFMSLNPSAFCLIISRFIQGLILGSISVINPSYVREMMPKQISGKMWTLHQMLFTSGLAGGFILVFFYEKILNLEQDQYWKLIFGFSILSCSVQFYLLTFTFSYQTPKYLVSRKKYNEAQQILHIIYIRQYVDEQFQSIKKLYSKKKQEESEVQLTEISQLKKKFIDKQNRQVSGKIQLLKTNRVAIFAGFSMAFFQQFYGQPSVVQYGVQLTNRTFPQFWNIFPAFINLSGVFGSFLSIFAVKKFGRRQLMLKGGAAMAALLLLISICFAFIDTLHPAESFIVPRLMICTSVIVLRTIGGVTVGPITWLLISQIIQPQMVSFCGGLNWISLAIVNMIFPVLVDINSEQNPSFAYFCFSVISLLGFAINFKTVIETANKSQLQIREQYERNWPT